ncbi:MAG: ATP-binding protein [Treponema sp.]|nr:ATP-binding protein [Treponema sp.]
MNNNFSDDAILKIGSVIAIQGRTISILVDKNKNTSELFFNGQILKNVAVGSYIEIKKGFTSIIGKVDGEELSEDKIFNPPTDYHYLDKNHRILRVSISGYINDKYKFIGGIKEMPLIGDEVFILTEKKLHLIHNLLKTKTALSISIATTDIEEIPIDFPIDGLFNSHIAIFGNTGSGKSNTLVSLYTALFANLDVYVNFRNACRFLFFDFNGEFSSPTILSQAKKVYHLSTANNMGDKIPILQKEFMDIETLSILFEATEKTQRPFLSRTLNLYNKVITSDDILSYFQNILKQIIEKTLSMANKDIAYKLLDYIEEILSTLIGDTSSSLSLRNDISFHSGAQTFYLIDTKTYFNNDSSKIYETNIYKAVDQITTIDNFTNCSTLQKYYLFLLIQLSYDLINYKTQLDHILPVINRFKSRYREIEKVFNITDGVFLWSDSNIVVLNLFDVNIEMRKIIPLLMAKYVYRQHKIDFNAKSLSIIIDEAHNILSKNSFRETEDWKDYRLETFEEIIKEGRKFGVFITIASQRPNDISETIISQAHNYFIHQLINQRDLQMIGNAVSYIDKLTEESIPTLPVGTCIFSGIATAMPVKLHIKELPDDKKPRSNTIKFADSIGDEFTF